MYMPPNVEIASLPHVDMFWVLPLNATRLCVAQLVSRQPLRRHTSSNGASRFQLTAVALPRIAIVVLFEPSVEVLTESPSAKANV